MVSVNHDHMYFFTRRLGTFLGVVVPLLFAVVYAIPLTSILGGRESFDLYAAFFEGLPLYTFAEVVFIILYIFFTITSLTAFYRSSVGAYVFSAGRGAMYFLRSMCGLAAVIYIGYYIYVFRLPHMFSDTYLTIAFVDKVMTNGLLKYFLFVGAACTSFVFASSIPTLMFEWSCLASKRARNIVDIAAWVLTIILSVWSVRVFTAF